MHAVQLQPGRPKPDTPAATKIKRNRWDGLPANVSGARIMFECSTFVLLESADRSLWPLRSELIIVFVQVSGGCGIRTHEDASTP